MASATSSRRGKFLGNPPTSSAAEGLVTSAVVEQYLEKRAEEFDLAKARLELERPKKAAATTELELVAWAADANILDRSTLGAVAKAIMTPIMRKEMRDIEISPAFAIRSRSGEGNPMIQKSSVDGGIYFRSEELGVGSWEFFALLADELTKCLEWLCLAKVANGRKNTRGFKTPIPNTVLSSIQRFKVNNTCLYSTVCILSVR